MNDTSNRITHLCKALVAALPVALLCAAGCSSSAPPPPDAPAQVEATAATPAETNPTTPAEAATALPTADAPAAKECTTQADCGANEQCTGPEGCDAKWTCQAPKPCTRDLRPYCGCDGKTVQGSGSCPPAKYSKKGECTP